MKTAVWPNRKEDQLLVSNRSGLFCFARSICYPEEERKRNSSSITPLLMAANDILLGITLDVLEPLIHLFLYFNDLVIAIYFEVSGIILPPNSYSTFILSFIFLARNILATFETKL